MTYSANIVEIFSSLQGEGPLVGLPMTFVRFSLCTLGCKWCDTTYASKEHNFCKIEKEANTGLFNTIPNPISITILNDELRKFNNEYISITGGEPLLHTKFLLEWLSTIPTDKKILLETCGIYYKQLDQIISHVHTISMDIKLPSSTGLKPFWNEHSEFLKCALLNQKEIYIKIVVTKDTTDTDIQEAIKLIGSTNRHLPIILQPASETLKYHQKVTQEKLLSFNRLFSAYLPNVQLVHQMHKEWNIL